jgi:hypothetical protein
MWSPKHHCFLMRGEHIPFTAVEDIYFLTGLPFRGTPLLADPVLPRDTHLRTVAKRYCSGEHYMTGIAVSISGIDALLHRCLAAMIVRVYGSRTIHRISGGELFLMERVVLGHERFTWGLTLHAQMITQLDHCRARGARGVCIWLHSGSLFFGESADAVPEGATRGTKGTRAALEAVVSDFGSPQWW